MTAALNFIKTRTDTRNLARPRILTLNNQPAEIKISTNEAIGASTVTNASSSSSTSSVQAERVQTGVFLTVTPQANITTREITMAIYPKVIEASNGITVSGQLFKDPEERGAQSILKVLDGETVIIGGLLRSKKSTAVTKLPFLGDIPFVGGVFRHKDIAGSERELIIFITPHILTDKKEQVAQKSVDIDEVVHALDKASPRKVMLDRFDEISQSLNTLEQTH
jgi:type II secretory pathway component GspD/PulD (secretin)